MQNRHELLRTLLSATKLTCLSVFGVEANAASCDDSYSTFSRDFEQYSEPMTKGEANPGLCAREVRVPRPRPMKECMFQRQRA